MSKAAESVIRSRRRAAGIVLFAAGTLLLVWAIAPVIAGRPEAGKFEREPANLVKMRSQWFFHQRAYPLGFIPAGARQRAIEHMGSMLKERGLFVPRFSVPDSGVKGPTTWTAIGPQPTSGTFFGNTSGRILSVAVDPHDGTNHTVYAGGADGGVWVSTDAGNTWTALSDTQPSLAIGSIALDPLTTPTTIYAGTGESDFGGDFVFEDSFYGAGVLKSVDGGVTWTQDITLSQPDPLDPVDGGKRIGAIAVNPKFNLNPLTSQVLLAAVFGSRLDGTGSGIYQSQDSGHSWTLTLPTNGAKVIGTDVAYDPSTPNLAYAALGTDFGDPNNGVYKSADGGATWTRLTITGANQPSFGRIALAVGPPVPPATVGSLYAAIANANTSSTGFLGMFKSTDGGSTWTNLSNTPPVCNNQCFFDMVVRVSPVNVGGKNVVFFGGAAGNTDADTLFRSTDGGNTWNNVSIGSPSGTLLHVDHHGLAFSGDGSKLYVGNDGGSWRSDSPGGTVDWVNLNTNLQLTEFYPGVSVHPSTDLISFAGTQDNGFQFYSGNIALTSWMDLGLAPCGDGGRTAVDPNVPTTVYAACSDEGVGDPQFNFINKSISGGVPGTFTIQQTGIGTSDNADFIPPLTIDTLNPQNLYYGTEFLYQSTNGAGSWTPIANFSNGGTDATSTIAVAPSNSNTVYVGTIRSVVAVTTNASAGAGATFNLANAGLPVRFVTSIVVSPTISTTAYVAFSGYSSCGACDHLGHIFATVNGGASWTDITGNLPDAPVNAIVADPDIANTLYIGTDVGVFATSNSNAGAGTVWAILGSGLPSVVVESFAFREGSRTLRAATHGRGVFDFPVGSLPAFHLSSIFPVSSVAASNAPPVSLSVTGAGFTPSSVVNFNGAALATTFVDAQDLTATIPSSDQVTGGNAAITVMDTGNTTNALTFSVFPIFSIGTVSPSSITISAGQKATYTVPVNPVGMFMSGESVQLSCNFTPAPPTQSSCSFSQNPVSLGGNVTLKISTKSRAALPVFPDGHKGPWATYGISLSLLALLMAGTFIFSRKAAPRRRLAMGFALGLLAALLGLQAACGGSSGGGGGGGGGGGTQPGTFMVTVSGTSGATVETSAPVTLIVQ